MKTPKYAAPKPIEIPDRRWPGQIIDKSPIWCSVDLRDGNQALPNPLSPSQKLEYFNLLTKIGIKHIEVSFPSASHDDFDFTHGLIEQKNIPDDVFIMVLSQCREHLIDRTMESIAGVERGIVHLYCAASQLHMDHVFGMDRESTIEMVKQSVAQVRDAADAMSGSDIRLEFSPEEYTDTDMDFSLELCEAVFETWGSASADKPIIFNLPATVERRPPNQYADMIELFCRNFSARDKILEIGRAHV